MKRSPWSLVVACAVAWPCSGRAADETLRVAVLPTIEDGPYGRTTSQAIFDEVVADLEWRMTLDRVSYNELFVDGTEPVARRLRRCGSDAACLRKEMQVANVDLVLDAIVNFTLDPPLVTLSLVDRTTGEAVVSEVGELPTGGLETGGLETGALATLTRTVLDRAHYVRAGTLVVEIKPPGGSVFAPGGEFQSRAPDRVQVRLPAGEHNISVELLNHQAAQRHITIEAGTLATMSVILEPLAEPAPSLVERPWFWVAVGVVVAGAATAAVVVTASGTDARCLCVTTAAGSCGTCAP